MLHVPRIWVLAGDWDTLQNVWDYKECRCTLAAHTHTHTRTHAHAHAHAHAYAYTLSFGCRMTARWMDGWRDRSKMEALEWNALSNRWGMEERCSVLRNINQGNCYNHQIDTVNPWLFLSNEKYWIVDCATSEHSITMGIIKWRLVFCKNTDLFPQFSG